MDNRLLTIDRKYFISLHMGKILKATRELEYVAFLYITLETAEGLAYLFVAIDAYTSWGFNIGIERELHADTILKNIYLLTEQDDFKSKNHQGFTLVLEENQELEERIKNMIRAVGGNLIYNKTYNNHIANPFLAGILRYSKHPEE